MSTPETDELRDLILHRLPESRARELEEQLVLAEDCAERLQEASYDLMDDYANGRLGPTDRAAVERYLLGSEERRLQVATARAIARAADSAAGREIDRGASDGRPGGIRRTVAWRRDASHLRVWTMGALLAACAVVVVLLLTRLSPGTLGRSAPRPAASQREVSNGLAVPTVTLLANAARGSAERPVSVPSDATSVRLQAEVGSAPAREYRLAVLDAAGHVLFSAHHLVARTAGPYVYVETEVPARTLAPEARVQVAPEGVAPLEAGFSWDVRIQRRN